MCGAALIQRDRSGAMTEPSGSPVNWEGPSRTSPWCLLLSSRCFWGSLPRYTAVTLILISGSVFGGAQTQPQWVSSYSMGTKLDALHNWLDADHGHPFWLAVSCGHPFWTAVAGIRALCLACWVSYHSALWNGHISPGSCLSHLISQKGKLRFQTFLEVTELRNWVYYWNSTFYFQSPYLFIF